MQSVFLVFFFLNFEYQHNLLNQDALKPECALTDVMGLQEHTPPQTIKHDYSLTICSSQSMQTTG